jgi:secondary thiamine-phosphate synthase enzyme
MQLQIETPKRTAFVDITEQVQKATQQAKGKAVILSSPHTSCGITINEGYDPDVPADMLRKLEELIPKDDNYNHSEGNSDAHLKTALVGTSVMIPMKNNTLKLGRWQTIFLAEFDGPRTRTIDITVI